MYYGFDIGGTKIEFGAFDDQLQRIATERISTPCDDYDALVATVVSLTEKYDQQFNLRGLIGIGVPGIESTDNHALLTVNIPCANGHFFRRDLEEKLQRPVQLENDANCFALSEAWDEELVDYPSVMGLILGTGFGGGFIFDGKVFSGSNHVAGEVGHMRVPIDAWMVLGDHPPYLPCGCGKKGCLDNYLSGRGFELLYQHFYGEEHKAIDIIEEFEKGAPRSCEFVDRYLDFMAVCFANLFSMIDPHVVVLGGGLSNFNAIYRELPERISNHLLSVSRCPPILKAKHGDSGGVRGAAFLNIQHQRECS